MPYPKVESVVVFEDAGGPDMAYYTSGVILTFDPATCNAFLAWWEKDAAGLTVSMETATVPLGKFTFPCIMPGGAQGHGYWCPGTDPSAWRVGTDCHETAGGNWEIIVDGDIKSAPLAIPSNPALFYFPPPDRGLEDSTAAAMKAFWELP